MKVLSSNTPNFSTTDPAVPAMQMDVCTEHVRTCDFGPLFLCIVHNLCIALVRLLDTYKILARSAQSLPRYDKVLFCSVHVTRHMYIYVPLYLTSDS